MKKSFFGHYDHSLRKSLKLTQKDFARILGVSSRTVEAWEIGRSKPSKTACLLMRLIKEDPRIIKKLMHIKELNVYE